MPKRQPNKRKSAVDRCIFWEPNKPHLPLTYEHIWGRWLKNIVINTENKHRMSHTQIGRPGTLHITEMSHRTGGPLQANEKIVCRGCNNGWMSEIQKAAKPFLVPLIQGRTSLLGLPAQRAISAWCAMATMTAEYLVRDVTALSITQSERDWLRDNGTPPSNWKIWIGRANGRMGMWRHYIAPILAAKDTGKASSEGLARPNTQTTTFIIGYLLVHVMSSTGSPETVTGWNWPLSTRIGLNLPRIFPTKESVIVWPSQPFTDAEVKLISDAFERVVEAAARSPFTGRRMF
jgi:hypothetical protein